MAATKFIVPEYKETALDAIPGICKTVRDTFQTHKTKDLEWRLVQLRKLYWALVDLTPQIKEALKQDLQKSEYEAVFTEIDWLKNDCMFMIKHLKTFAQDDKLGRPHVPLTYSLMKFRIRKDPMGSVLIISAYNYPLHLLLSPFVGAIAAGCTAVLKPTEMAPHTAMIVIEIMKRLDSDAYGVVNGAIPETTALLDQKWDKILYTGSANVGAIIAKKAAETLTPVCLELGGRNPAFVTKNANIALAARRLLWGKVHNAGQVCMSHNYILVEREVVDTLIAHLNESFREFFPNGAKASPDLSRVINARHFHRMKRMLDNSKGRIVMGGQLDESELFIEPTAVLVDSMDDSMVVEESFGPIFSIFPVDNLDQGLAIANKVHRTPLTLFAFGSQEENKKVLNEMTSGGATLNDSFTHGSLGTVPFGGVGDSGWGSYRGKASFDCFTHHRTVAETPAWLERALRVRYMPYDWSELRRLARLSATAPNFDRDGAVVSRGLGYWLGFIFGLGGGSAKGAFLRWIVVAALGAAVAYRKGLV